MMSKYQIVVWYTGKSIDCGDREIEVQVLILSFINCGVLVKLNNFLVLIIFIGKCREGGLNEVYIQKSFCIYSNFYYYVSLQGLYGSVCEVFRNIEEGDKRVRVV